MKARIHVILSQESDSAIVIRRGPSKSVGTFLWDRKTNAVRLGQWMKGRIYERRCDLSPDGKYFLYFAMNGKWKSESAGSWTAVSIAPYLKAITFFPKGDAWQGGGLWTGNRSYWLNRNHGIEASKDTNQVVRDRSYAVNFQFANAECLGVYYPRLLRDGWKFIERQKIKIESSSDYKHCDVFEKYYKDGWTLVKFAYSSVEHPVGKGVYWDEHLLRNEKSNREIQLADWEWAEVDRGKLLWAEGGELFSGSMGQKDAVLAKNLVFDFNQVNFEPVVAPY
jgi:hypothetical protein